MHVASSARSQRRRGGRALGRPVFLAVVGRIYPNQVASPRLTHALFEFPARRVKCERGAAGGTAAFQRNHSTLYFPVYRFQLGCWGFEPNERGVPPELFTPRLWSRRPTGSRGLVGLFTSERTGFALLSAHGPPYLSNVGSVH